MEALVLDATDELPEVILDPSRNIFSIKGISIPENAKVFYRPLMAWFTLYGDEPNDETVVTIKMDYFNTSSSKPLIQMLGIIEKILDKGHDIKILWLYAEDDDDIKETGEEFSEIVRVPFEIVSYDPFA